MNNAPFEQSLLQAGANPPLPGDFNKAVWTRIESRELAETTAAPGAPRRWSAWLATAAAGMAATIVLGAWLGLHARPSIDQAKADYVRSISPFVRHP